jgi:hypothetical protein
MKYANSVFQNLRATLKLGELWLYNMEEDMSYVRRKSMIYILFCLI